MSAHAWPLTPTQQGMLLHRQLAGPATGVDIEQIVCTLEAEALDTLAFVRAWHDTLARHAALRARFAVSHTQESMQEIVEAVELPVRHEDWRGQVPERLAQWLADDRARGVDPSQAPAMRLALLRCGQTRWQVVWTVHHAVCDGRSFVHVLGEVFGRYDAARTGTAFEPAAAAPWPAHLARVAALDAAGAQAFWRERLAGFESPTPLPGRAQPARGRGLCAASVTPRLQHALVALAAARGLTLGTLVQGAWALLLERWSGQGDVVFGAVRSGRAADTQASVGCLINTLPVRVLVDGDLPVVQWLGRLRAREQAVRPFELAALSAVQAWSPVRAAGGEGRRLFDSLVVYDHASLDAQMKALGPAFAHRHFELFEQTHYPLTLYAWGRPRLTLRLAYDEPRFTPDTARRMVDGLVHGLERIAANPDAPLSSLSLLRPEDEQALRAAWQGPRVPVPEGCIHHAFEAQVARTPESVALVDGERTLSYAGLEARANALARRLIDHGATPGTPVGVCVSRGADMVVALLAVLKAGAAYLPLDPSYPRDRLAYMLSDARAPLLLTQRRHAGLLADPDRATLFVDDETVPSAAGEQRPRVRPDDLAYVIYTSGSTGRPKGTMVEHRQVMNFFAGMDASVPPPAGGAPGTWLAVTSLAFDISVLELLWTLTRGWRVVLQPQPPALAPVPASASSRPVQFSLMFFPSAASVSDENDKYRLMLDAARFADEHGFTALWTPERHFHDFGGLHPNPAVTSAALAAVTRRIALRAGSVVAALHHPARIAEEWAVVDNLSRGRVGLSFASGWQPRDFVLAPAAYESAGAALRATVDKVRRLWRGESLVFDGPQGRPTEVRTWPRPLQPELPVWLTAAGAPETFRAAGELGAGVLTHLLGQTHDELAGKIALYRRAWREAGHPGGGHVTLMLHAFVGDDTDAVRETVRAPLTRYLGSSLQLVKGFASAWSAFKKRADGSAADASQIDLDSLSPQEREGLLAFSFERYFDASGLFGDETRALATVQRVTALGVDEIACLIDFGVDERTTLEHLRHLARVRERAQPDAAAAVPSIAQSIERHRVTHLQCTPSLAGALAAEPASLSALARLDALLLGGETLPPSLAAALRAAGVCRLLNMYGPTETTVWSSVYEVGDDDTRAASVPIGRPIANTTLHVLDARGRLAPPGVAGELHIGGAGVVRGYLWLPELTAERFVPDGMSGHGRLYRTGDLVRRRDDGALEFLGRIDHQVKVRGHRIELGEIEAVLAAFADVREAVVVAREDTPGEVQLVAYVIPADAVRPPDAQSLRQRLRQSLPEVMVPAHVVTLTQWPQTPNRKIDRRALPPPRAIESPAPAVASCDAAASGIERTIAAVWQDVLQLRQVNPEANFFDLGGHSLLAVKAHRLLVEALHAPQLAITDLFRFPTVRSLAAHLQAGGGASSTLAASAERVSRRREAMAARRGSRPPGGITTRGWVVAGVLLAALWEGAVAGPTPLPVRAEIETLLGRLQASGCEFQRNGSWHGADEARTHLLRKLKALEDRTTLSTTEQFIRLGATSSSASGQAYQVRCGSTPSVPSAQWMMSELAALRAARR